MFCPLMARRLIHALRVKLDAGRTRSIGRTHIPPELCTPPVVRLGRLVVSAEARHYLDHIGKPLLLATNTPRKNVKTCRSSSGAFSSMNPSSATHGPGMPSTWSRISMCR